MVIVLGLFSLKVNMGHLFGAKFTNVILSQDIFCSKEARNTIPVTSQSYSISKHKEEKHC